MVYSRIGGGGAAYAPIDAAESSECSSKGKVKQMKKLMVVLCVLFISSTATAFFEDFEGWTDADLAIAPWGSPPLANGTIASPPQGSGNPSGSAVDLGYAKWAWLSLPEADQYAVGIFEFDLSMHSWYPPGGTPPEDYQPNIHLYVSDDDIASLPMNWIIEGRPGVGTASVDLYDPYQDEVLLTDFMVRTDPWTNFRIEFDCDTDTYDFYINGSLKLDDKAFSGFANEINRISWTNDRGYYAQIDNVSVTPEPATMALLALGGLMIRRKK